MTNVRRVKGGGRETSPSRSRRDQGSDGQIKVFAGGPSTTSQHIGLLEKWKKYSHIPNASALIMEVAGELNSLLEQREQRARTMGTVLNYTVKSMNPVEKKRFKTLFGLSDDQELQEYFETNNVHGIVKLFLFLNDLFKYIYGYKKSETSNKNKKMNYESIRDFYKDDKLFLTLDNTYCGLNDNDKKKVQDFIKECT